MSPFQSLLARRLSHRTPATVDLTDAMQAGVAVVLAPDPDAILIIRRAERAGDPWSGHMGLPGGRFDPADADLLTTALRECGEEVGIPLDHANLLGALDDVSPRTPGLRSIVVRPFVFAVPARPPLTLSGEVAEALWVEIEQLRRAEIYRPTTRRLRGEERTFPAYHLGPHVVWGLTERILTPLLSLAEPG